MSARPTDRHADTDPAALERDIEATRAEIDALVSALERKLSPGEAVDRAMGFARRHGGEFAGHLGRAVKANPMAAVLTSIGLAWLIGGRDAAPAPAAPARPVATPPADDARPRGAADVASEGAQALRSGIDRLFAEQPFAAGALGLAAGALLAAMTPASQHDRGMLQRAGRRSAGDALH